MNLLNSTLHRTCERCFAVAARADALHLCGCDEQANVCAACRPLCKADNFCLRELLRFFQQATIWEMEVTQ